MDEVLVCVGGVWSVDAYGAVSCTGTIESQTKSDFVTGIGLVNQETFEAFWPWALLMFATAFAVRLMRKTIYSRS